MTLAQAPSGLQHETRPGREAQSPDPPRLRAPFALIVLTCAAWAATLNNAVFIDESVYIRAGRAYLRSWFSGEPLPADLGAGFSGLPVLYPVLAGSLDLIGGLALVRLFSLVCIIATLFIVRDLTSRIFNPRAGLMAAALFGLTGPVLYTAHLGTFDALVILLLASALWVGIVYDGAWTAALLAALLVLAVMTKYTAYVFVPPILVLTLFSPYSLMHSSAFSTWLRQPRPPWGRIIRNAVTTFLVGSLILLVYLAADDRTLESLRFTTTARSALSPAPRGSLVAMVPDYAWPVFFAAALGLVWLGWARRWTALLFGLGLFATALLLPIAQVQLGEAVSFQKHLAYSAMFLAPLAGWGFARPWRLAIWTPVLVWFVILTAMWGFFRSHDLIQYPDVRPVVDEIEITRGSYLSSSADSLAYYTIDDPGVQWKTTFALYSGGPEKIRAAVRNERYEAVVIHAGPTGSTIQDEGQQTLLEALEKSDYVLDRVGEDEEWLIYSRPA